MALFCSSYILSSLPLWWYISFFVKACAEVYELCDLFQGDGSIVYYIDARCVSANDYDLSLLGIQ